MRPSNCPNCDFSGDDRPNIRQHGTYYRTSDSCLVRRYRCMGCKKGFSDATFDLCYWQRKRQKNHHVCMLLNSGVSMRRIAMITNVNRITVARILEVEAMRAEFELMVGNSKRPKVAVMEFDDLETFEHTKLKPLSVTVAVDKETRRILGAEVSQMAAKGKLAAQSLEKYGPRKDERRAGRERLFKRIQNLVREDAVIKSDQNPYYPKDVRKFFPGCDHQTFKGRKPAHIGYGEKKIGGFDPLFTLNHTCAEFRDNIKRLLRKTWCTTKRPDRLYAQLILFSAFYNSTLIPQT